MAGYYLDPGRQFRLFSSEADPRWRRPQLAALGAVLAQWSLAESEAPLISVPTGVGKTAIALAAPFLAAAKRVLVVVPTQELRRQTVERFRTQDVLRRIGALPADDGS
ncbi:MAG: DEAD/DEAH box helicase family protein, partial [Acidimicrobiia bacterium]